MSVHFHVGQKVVCVNNELTTYRVPGIKYREDGSLDGLTEGLVYTVRSIFYDPRTDQHQLRLCEITRSGISKKRPHIEAGFDVRRFRPVIERKTDISIFKAMLTKTRVGVRA